MKKLLLLILLLPAVLYGQTITKKKGVDIIIKDEVVVPPDSIPCACEDGEDGKTPTVTVGTTANVPYGQPAKVTGVPTPTGIRLDFEIPGGQNGTSPSCPTCPPSGGSGTATRAIFDVTNYGARGDGNFDDTQAFQNCFNAAIAARGKVIIPSAPNHYKITNTIVCKAGQMWIDVEAWGWGIGADAIKYYGPSGRPVFQIIGAKQGMWNGLKVGIAPGISGVTLFDVDTGDGSSSTTGVTFKNMYLSLGNMANVAFRIGHTSAGGNGDVANLQFENIAIYGQQNLIGGVPGQIGYLHEGRNALSFTWIGGFVSHVDRVYTNKSQPGAAYDRGNGSCFFYGLGGSSNNIDFEISFESSYLFDGGRWEAGNKFLSVLPTGAYSLISVRNMAINEYFASGSVIDIQQAVSLTLDNISVNRPERGTLYNNIIGLSANGRNARLMVTGGNFSSNTLYTKTGTTLWDITVIGASKADKVWSNGFFNNEIGVRK